MNTTNRRMVLTGAAALTAAPLMRGVAQADAATPIAKLWATVGQCDKTLVPHRSAIADAERLRGVSSGWMYVHGSAYEAGQTRYEALVQILKEAPRSAGDLAIQAQASLHPDIEDGPRAWASSQLANHVLTYSAAA
ncbi:MAG: hypothetical protein ACRCUX_10505 [Beijerinckiaceae bacterium]